MIALGGMMLNIILNLILIPQFKAKGAAIASMSTQYITAGAQILLAHLVFKFHIRWMLAFRYIVFIALTYGLFWFASTFETYFIWRILFAAGASFLIALLFRLIRPLELFKVLKYGDN